jgi:two-component system phosphate regulon response regulator PhoB
MASSVALAERPDPPSDQAWLDGEEEAPAPAAQPTKIVVGAVEIDLLAHRLNVNGSRVRVTAMQMRLLVHLATHRDAVVSRADLLREVWGYHGEVQTRTVDIHVQRLRERLGPAAVLISTVRGVGYRLSEEPE